MIKPMNQMMMQNMEKTISPMSIPERFVTDVGADKELITSRRAPKSVPKVDSVCNEKSVLKVVLKRL